MVSAPDSPGRAAATADAEDFERFRCAVCGRDEAAWETIVARYQALVAAWIRRHPAGEAVRHEVDECVQGTFVRFWRAMTPERFASFSTLAALMQYLKLCAHSAIVDVLRAELRTPRCSFEEALGGSEDESQDASVAAVDRAEAHEVWRAIAREFVVEADRKLIYLAFALDLTPREVQRRHPDRYPCVADVYRAKRSVLDRLRRSHALQQFWQPAHASAEARHN